MNIFGALNLDININNLNNLKSFNQSDLQDQAFALVLVLVQPPATR